MNQLSKAIPAFIIGLSLLACTKEFVYTPAEPEDATKTYVGADPTAPRSLDVDGADIIVPFLRNNASGDLEVPVVVNDPSGLFKLSKSTIKFANGSKTANAVVSYSYDALVPETVYNITVEIADDYASKYSIATFPIACKKAWQNLGTAQFYDDWWVGGPFEKTLLKSPDGTETYRLMNPWTAEEVAAGGLEPGDGIPYLEFFIDEKGLITYGPKLNLGFYYGGRTCHNWFPTAVGDPDSVAANCMVMDKVAQFTWYPVMNEGKSWWGISAVAYISFPGGPDLKTLLGL